VVKLADPSEIGAGSEALMSEMFTGNSGHNDAGKFVPVTTMDPPVVTVHGPGVDSPHVKLTAMALSALKGAAGGPTSV